MKKTIIKAFALSAFTLAVSSCTEEMEWKDSKVTAPAELFGPENNKTITLQASATASNVFEWGSAYGEDGGAPMYEVLFDKEGGDFSAPIYSVAADANGSATKATISHKTLNSIAGIAGAKAGETSTVQWTVRAWRGISNATCGKVNTVSLTRYFSIENIPGTLYLEGSAVDESEKIAFASPENGMFEVIVKLKPGEIKMNDGGENSYAINGEKIAEGSTAGYAISEAGIYRICMDFNVASVTAIKKVKTMAFYFCESNNEVDLPYKGNGVFEGDVQMDRIPTSWGSDERYRFHMTYEDGSKIVWGATASNDGKPAEMTEGDSYFTMYEYPLDGSFDQWSMKWKWHGDFDYKLTVVTCSFNGAAPTHFYKLK